MSAEHVLPDSKIDVAQFSLTPDVFHLNNWESLRSAVMCKPVGSQGLANSFDRKLLNPSPSLEGPAGPVHPQDWSRKKKISFFTFLTQVI